MVGYLAKLVNNSNFAMFYGRYNELGYFAKLVSYSNFTMVYGRYNELGN